MTQQPIEQELGYAPLHVHVENMPKEDDRPKGCRVSHRTVILTAANPFLLAAPVDPARIEMHIEPIGNPVVMTSGLSQASDPANQIAAVTGITQPTPSQPAVPASTVAVQNTNLYPVLITISGGAVTGVTINGASVGNGDGTYLLEPGLPIFITYTSAPTWVWANANPSVSAVNAFPNGRILSNAVGEYTVPGGENEIWFTGNTFPTLVGITIVREI